MVFGMVFETIKRKIERKSNRNELSEENEWAQIKIKVKRTRWTLYVWALQKGS